MIMNNLSAPLNNASPEAMKLNCDLIDKQIKFQESQINNSCNEEDIKMRETKIKNLHKELASAKRMLIEHNARVDNRSVIRHN
jgi:hypothetical protein